MRKKFIVLLMIIFLLFLSSCNCEGKQYRKLKNVVVKYGELTNNTENLKNYNLDLDSSTYIEYSDFSNTPDCVGILYGNNNQSIKNSDGEYVPFRISILLNQKGFEKEYETEIQLFGIHHERLLYKNAFYEYCNKGTLENFDIVANCYQMYDLELYREGLLILNEVLDNISMILKDNYGYKLI